MGWLDELDFLKVSEEKDPALNDFLRRLDEEAVKGMIVLEEKIWIKIPWGLKHTLMLDMKRTMLSGKSINFENVKMIISHYESMVKEYRSIGEKMDLLSTINNRESSNVSSVDERVMERAVNAQLSEKLVRESIVDIHKYIIHTLLHYDNDGKSDTNSDTIKEVPRDPMIDRYEIYEELEQLDAGNLSSKVLYEWKWWEILYDMDSKLYDDDNRYFIVNNELKTIFMHNHKTLSEVQEFQKLCGQTSMWLDLWTGNWIITRANAEWMLGYFSQQRLRVAIESPDSFVATRYNWKVDLMMADLSKEQLRTAKKWFDDSWYNYNLTYLPTKFEEIMEYTEHVEWWKLITMFNMMANFSKEEMKWMLQLVANRMGPDDIFMPSFFRNEKYFASWWESSTDFCYSPEYREKVREMYNNEATKDWCVTSFCHRYGVDPKHVQFIADWREDEEATMRVRLVIDEWLIIQPHWPIGPRHEIHSENNVITCFDSRRLSLSEMKELANDSWLERIDHIEWSENLSVFPLLKKK